MSALEIPASCQWELYIEAIDWHWGRDDSDHGRATTAQHQGPTEDEHECLERLLTPKQLLRVSVRVVTGKGIPQTIFP